MAGNWSSAEPAKDHDCGGKPGEKFPCHQHFAPHRREHVIVQTLIHHFAAKQIGEDADAAEEDRDTQVEELENAREDLYILAERIVASLLCR